MENLKLAVIRLDGGTQFRPRINQDKVKEYKEKMLEDAVFPPIEVMFDGSEYWLWDGFHRYFSVQEIGVKSIEAHVTKGTQKDAIRAARKANGSHGLSRDYETLCNVVRDALADPDNAGASNREIARQCDVSHNFVASVKDPSKKSAARAKKASDSVVPAPKNEVEPSEVVPAPERPSLTQDYGPSAEELEANERAIQADLDAMNKFLEADDKMAQLAEENKRLRHMNESLQMRINSLMVEKNEAIKDAKAAQRQLDKINKAKK